MRKLIQPAILVLALGFFFQACQTPEQKLLSDIQTLEDELFGNQSEMIDRAKASELVDAYEQYANANPDDAKAGEYLFRAGDICMNTGYPEKAIEIYTRVYDDYPTYEKRPESLFLIAFTYENQLMNLKQAELSYRRFIELYPEHELANDAEILLQHLGKSPDEMVKEFEEKLKANEGL
jgi:tetratricopeptide (TPR) repeat protein